MHGHCHAQRAELPGWLRGGGTEEVGTGAHHVRGLSSLTKESRNPHITDNRDPHVELSSRVPGTVFEVLFVVWVGNA
ncbi:MAG TPA: hypothetical protein VGO47_01830 [Chlamydiales bacterium]|nr:hypothetical protein [Chlamydiales bacterium]